MFYDLSSVICCAVYDALHTLFNLYSKKADIIISIYW
jgi:hypothetical protein